MKGKIKTVRIIRAFQILLIGIEIEFLRKILELTILIQKNFTSESVIRKSNELSRLGIKWMLLSAETQCSPVQGWQI